MLFFPQNGVFLRDMLIIDGFDRFVKLVLLASASLTLMLSWSYLERTKLMRPEYVVLLMLAVLGMMLMVSANDMMALYVGLELQSLALYILAAYRRDSALSSEAGLKYFVLGALASGFLLYGLSLLYGYAGDTSFNAVAKALLVSHVPVEVDIAVVFVCAALAFKISAVPFHMWTPDVYEGAPTPVAAFFAVAPKLAAMALLTRILIGPLGHVVDVWQPVLCVMAFASLAVGGLAGLRQQSLKRLLAYSAISNIGFMLLGVALGNEAGLQAMLTYLVIYSVGTLGAFSVVLCLRRKGRTADRFADLSGLAKTHPLLALALAVCLFSLSGAPPLAGFFGKLFMVVALVRAGWITSAVVAVLFSVLALAFYLRVVKAMYFEETTGEHIDPVPEYTLRLVATVLSLALLLFVINPVPLIENALFATQSLLSE